MAKYGKIGSLPHELREQINLRLLDNQPAKDILQWLNPLPVVQALLSAKFQGSPVNDDNLSEWKNHRGYREWFARREARDFVQSAVDPQAPEDQLLAKLSPDQLINALVVELAAIARGLHDQPESALWPRVRQLGVELSRIRRDNFRQDQLKLEKQHLAIQQTQAEQGTEAAHRKWSQRPEVRAQLYSGLAPDTIALIDRDHGIVSPPPLSFDLPQKGPNP